MKKITLKTLPEATEQEVFDYVARHLLVQGERSETSSGCCRYKSANGLCCAAGCLINQDEYSTTFENIAWHGLVKRDLVPKTHEILISTLQAIHDGGIIASWKLKLKIVASDYKLQFNENLYLN